MRIKIRFEEVLNEVKNLDSYEVIKHLNVSFWNFFHDSWCSHLPDNIKEVYDLSNHTTFPIFKRSMQITSNVDYLDGRFSMLSH